jgi:hypothetical protein
MLSKRKKKKKGDRPLFFGAVPISPYIKEKEGLSSFLTKRQPIPLFSVFLRRKE